MWAIVSAASFGPGRLNGKAGDALFDPGRATLKETAKAGLDKVAAAIKKQYPGKPVKVGDTWEHKDKMPAGGIEAIAPGFARVLQTYMTVARLSFDRRTALEYLILAVKGCPHAS